MSLRRRLINLEDSRPAPAREGSPEARQRMKEHLNRIAELRRGGATVENNAELAAMSATIRRHLDQGEGGR